MSLRRHVVMLNENACSAIWSDDEKEKCQKFRLENQKKKPKAKAKRNSTKAAMKKQFKKEKTDKCKDLNHTSETQKKEFLEKLSQDIVDKYIATEKFDLEALKQSNTQEEGRPMCGYPGCKKSFAVDWKCRSKQVSVSV
ncbi:Hypothetical predicted protein [Mytilus galloprovincialis]|uniref:Uncharacterized protein n=1 Tax=Mytilus galloprovincialis TaxID=29158 RepID=A0A8B6DXH1_MYTGA|nr:Hypothetical predicted protein [Mytilus galloprovincialis]